MVSASLFSLVASDHGCRPRRVLGVPRFPVFKERRGRGRRCFYFMSRCCPHGASSSYRRDRPDHMQHRHPRYKTLGLTTVYHPPRNRSPRQTCKRHLRVFWTLFSMSAQESSQAIASVTSRRSGRELGFGYALDSATVNHPSSTMWFFPLDLRDDRQIMFFNGRPQADSRVSWRRLFSVTGQTIHAVPSEWPV